MVCARLATHAGRVGVMGDRSIYDRFPMPKRGFYIPYREIYMPFSVLNYTTPTVNNPILILFLRLLPIPYS
jgi:hypothetical protein